MEIIRIVQDSELGVKQTLEELGISRSTFYVWYRNYLEEGLLLFKFINIYMFEN